MSVDVSPVNYSDSDSDSDQLVKILPWSGYLQRNQALDNLIG